MLKKRINLFGDEKMIILFWNRYPASHNRWRVEAYLYLHFCHKYYRQKHSLRKYVRRQYFDERISTTYLRRKYFADICVTNIFRRHIYDDDISRKHVRRKYLLSKYSRRKYCWPNIYDDNMLTTYFRQWYTALPLFCPITHSLFLARALLGLGKTRHTASLLLEGGREGEKGEKGREVNK